MGESNQTPGTALLSLQIPAALRYLALVRAATMEICEQIAMPPFKAAQLEMAVDEACANIIEHGYEGGCAPEEETTHPGVGLHYFEAPDGLMVEITDRGGGFDTEGADQVTPQEYLANQNERGLGLFIIRTFVDRLEYVRSAEQANTLRLTKRR